MTSQWQKNYKKEAKDIIRISVEEYKRNIKKIEVIEQKFCEVGAHNTQNTLRFCIYCKRSFCKEHGDLEKGICYECKKLE